MPLKPGARPDLADMNDLSLYVNAPARAAGGDGLSFTAEHAEGAEGPQRGRRGSGRAAAIIANQVAADGWRHGRSHASLCDSSASFASSAVKERPLSPPPPTRFAVADGIR
jgi:hypothetical protein